MTLGHAIHVPSINEIYLGSGPCIINAVENPEFSQQYIKYYLISFQSPASAANASIGSTQDDEEEEERQEDYSTVEVDSQEDDAESQDSQVEDSTGGALQRQRSIESSIDLDESLPPPTSKRSTKQPFPNKKKKFVKSAATGVNPDNEDRVMIKEVSK